MSDSDSAQEIIEWAVRLLYLIMFLTLVISWNMFHLPFILPYLLAIIVLTYSGLLIANEEEAWEELNDRYVEKIAGY